MNKKQARYLEMAEKLEFTEEQKKLLSREDFSTNFIHFLFYTLKKSNDKTCIITKISLLDEFFSLLGNYKKNIYNREQDYKIFLEMNLEDLSLCLENIKKSETRILNYCDFRDLFIEIRKVKRELDLDVLVNYIDIGIEILESRSFPLYTIITFFKSQACFDIVKDVNSKTIYKEIYEMCNVEYYEYIKKALFLKNPYIQSYFDTYENNEFIVKENYVLLSNKTNRELTLYFVQNGKKILYIQNELTDMKLNIKKDDILNMMQIKISDACIEIQLKNSDILPYNFFDINRIYDFNVHKEIVIFYNGNCYEKLNNDRFIPLSIKRMSNLSKMFPFAAKEAFNFICNFLEKYNNAPVLKDMLRLEETDAQIVFPLTFNECKNIHNMNQLFKMKWQKADRINWNKTDANLAYIILKTLPYVKEKDKEKLLQLKENTLVNSNYATCKKQKEYAKQLLFDYICKEVLKNNNEDNETEKIFIKDYIDMSIDNKLPVNIRFTSMKKLENAHIQLVEQINKSSNIHSVKIPENSIFLGLREALPKEFEWITNGKRLWLEGMLMQHCVNNYYTKINKDISAIYSFTYSNRRYTVEFGTNRSYTEYGIVQIQSKCNRGCPEEVSEYVNQLIKDVKCTKKHKNKKYERIGGNCR